MLRLHTVQSLHAEHQRSVAKHGDHGVGAPDVSDLARLAILAEEVGEVAEELNYDSAQGPQALHDELVQVANVALTWAQAVYDKNPEEVLQ